MAAMIPDIVLKVYENSRVNDLVNKIQKEEGEKEMKTTTLTQSKLVRGIS